MKTQAERLLVDLGRVLNRPAVLLLSALLALIAVGCSAKVQVERGNWSNSPSHESGEKDRTGVQVEFLTPPSEPKSSAAGERQVNISGSTVIVVVPEKGIHVEEAHTAQESPGHSGVNTKIGWPAHYLDHGLWAFLGYALVCLLIGLAVKMMIDTSKLENGGPMASTIALLVLAAIVLQTLPAADSGIQFVPLWPWNYSGFVPICLSILGWAMGPKSRFACR